MKDATGLGAGVRQWEVAHTSTNYIMKEMGFAVARKHALSLRRLFYALMAVVLVLALLTLWQPLFSVGSAVAVLAAAWVERWLFFAEAEHVVGLYYGAQAA
jgi:sulfite dehydrogenase (quinone) subunit SoeC